MMHSTSSLGLLEGISGLLSSRWRGPKQGAHRSIKSVASATLDLPTRAKADIREQAHKRGESTMKLTESNSGLCRGPDRNVLGVLDLLLDWTGVFAESSNPCVIKRAQLL